MIKQTNRDRVSHVCVGMILCTQIMLPKVVHVGVILCTEGTGGYCAHASRHDLRL